MPWASILVLHLCLDLNDVSDVIGDRAFAKNMQDIVPLASAFLKGMKRAGMASTGKHFPGHGSVKADSHVAAAIDHRSYEEIYQKDMQSFIQLQPQLDALMPAHVIYEQCRSKSCWFFTVLDSKSVTSSNYNLMACYSLTI